MASTGTHVVLGSRKSKLAMVQTELVKEHLSNAAKDFTFEIREISTVGDKILDKPLAEIGDKGLFTKELEEALYSKQIDLAVHSLKDVQTTLPPGLILGAITKREDQRDAFILNKKHKEAGLKCIHELKEGSVVGTSSLRRVAQLSRKYPHLQFKTVRGNLQTRLTKLDDESQGYDGLILAFAGLHRLGISSIISSVLTMDECYPAVGQGALGVECREGDERILKLLKSIHDPETALCCHSERAFMRYLQGGCSTPIAVLCQVERVGDIAKLTLNGRVLTLDGKECIEGSEHAEISIEQLENDHEKIGIEIGQKLGAALKSQGADRILASLSK